MYIYMYTYIYIYVYIYICIYIYMYTYICISDGVEGMPHAQSVLHRLHLHLHRKVDIRLP